MKRETMHCDSADCLGLVNLSDKDTSVENWIIISLCAKDLDRNQNGEIMERGHRMVEKHFCPSCKAELAATGYGDVA